LRELRQARASRGLRAGRGARRGFVGACFPSLGRRYSQVSTRALSGPVRPADTRQVSASVSAGQSDWTHNPAGVRASFQRGCRFGLSSARTSPASVRFGLRMRARGEGLGTGMSQRVDAREPVSDLPTVGLRGALVLRTDGVPCSRAGSRLGCAPDPRLNRDRRSSRFDRRRRARRPARLQRDQLDVEVEGARSRRDRQRRCCAYALPIRDIVF